MTPTPPRARSSAGQIVRPVRAVARALRMVWQWLLRWGLVVLGVLIVMLGLMLGPLPGPGGIPIIALGLVLILRGSLAAKKGFARLHRRYPRFVSPIRRILRWRWRRGSHTSL